MGISPNFLCIGAQKAGTTLLYEQLKKIGNVYLPDVKELHFFDRPSAYKKGIKWYVENYFHKAHDYQAVGEITPSYLFVDFVPKLILESLGEKIRFIVILRNPIDRAYSHYIMKYRTKEENQSFVNALILEHSRTERCLEDKKKYSYLQRGLYSKQIGNYLKWFSKDNFLFILFEDFVGQQDFCVKCICDFLGVEKDTVIENNAAHSTRLSLKEKLKFSLQNKNYNIASILASGGYPNMSAVTKRTLGEYYAEEIASLEEIIGKDLSIWLQ